MKKSLITMLVALVLVAAVGVGATLAFLTASTGPVTNTFTVGKVAISLDETGDGEVLTNGQKGMKYDNIIPGKTYAKAPVVTVDTTSENCYLFVKVENTTGVIEIVDSKLTQNDGWTALAGNAGVYYRVVKKTDSEDAHVFTLFEKVKVDEEVTELTDLSGKAITINAYAIQDEGFETVADAWAEVNKIEPEEN